MRVLSATVLQCVLVVGSGAAVGLLANALHPDGLKIGRDYFPSGVEGAAAGTPPPVTASSPAPGAPAAEAGQATIGSAVGGSAVPEEVKARLAQKGLATITFDEMKALFEDPMYQYGAYLFIDARNDAHFAEGHIPGAVQLDHYHVERYVGKVLEQIPGKLKVVVYCTGGNCEDSEFAAMDLVYSGMAASQLSIYLGGIEEWKARGMPVQGGE
jgi:rhodanese-related sulfurtransferase